MSWQIVDGRVVLLFLLTAVAAVALVRARRYDRSRRQPAAVHEHVITPCVGCGAVLYRDDELHFVPLGPCWHDNGRISPTHIPYQPFV